MLTFNYNKVASRWLIFSIEQGLALLAFLSSLLIASQFKPVLLDSTHLLIMALVNALISGVCMLALQTHAGIIRYSSIKDIRTIMTFSLFQFLAWMILYPVLKSRFPEVINGRMILLLNAILSGLFMISFRLFIKEVFHLGGRTPKNRHHVLIYGANSMGISTMRAVEMEKMKNKHVVAFVDGNRDRIGKSMFGKKIIPGDPVALSNFIRQNKIREFILAEDHLTPQKKSELLSICNENGIRPTVIPPISQWINGKIRSNQIKELTIESILNRDSIILTNDKTDEGLYDTTVLVSGAAGSIGSEICRQLCRYKVRKLIMLDQSESGLHDILTELKQTNRNEVELCIELASIRDEERINTILEDQMPDIVYHAAAYKHVPILENFPGEVVLTNVMGTMILSNAATRVGVKKFVMISTDKAVNPTNIMGASKRIAEIYVHSLEDKGQTKFITTRFGNVLGSNGSVVPLFRQQIEKGGPVTVTHPEISRYFMTIPEASSLVVEASIMGCGGEIFVFDMGRPEKILDMARKMIQLAGYKPEVEIPIEFSGLRKGEKLHEELFKPEENPLPTHHPKIMIAQHSRVQPDFHEMIRNLVSIARDQDHMSIRHLISRIVPEYHMDTTLRDTDVRILRPVTGADKSEFGNILNAGHHLNGNGGKLAGY
jgi:FlaA1/EpsC-like NDP-sugar epimerase